MRPTLNRRLAGAAAVAALAGLAAAVSEAKGPLAEATYPKVVEADIAHLTKLADTVKTKKTVLGRMRVTAALLAAYAQDSGDPKLAGVHAAALKVAAAAGKKDATAAAAAAKELAAAKGGETVKPVDVVKETKIDISDIMHVMGGATGGGLSTEKDIKDWMKKGVTDVKAAEVQAARSAVLADFTLVSPPEFGGKKKKEDWEKWSADMKKISVEAATEAAKGDKADKAKLKKLFSGIDAACTNCHNVFKDE